ncbi:unnamed protein product [Rhodiola kirilowii]
MYVDPDKVRAITSWAMPTNVKQLRGFLGLTGYYRRFVLGYAQTAASLTSLLRKDAFIWTSEATTTFTHLKELMTSTPMLQLPDFSRPFVVQFDASGTRMGTVLSQGGQPIAFFSKQFCPTLQRSSTYSKELADVVMAVTKWRQYLLGGQFTLEMDHQPLRVILTQTIHTSEQQRWIRNLMGYGFEVIYRPGRDNAHADALSRLPPA